MAASVASASKRGSTATWLPASSAWQRPDDRAVVVQRAGHHEAAVGREPAASVGASGSIERRVARHDQLGPAGRAARRRRLPRRRHGVGQRARRRRRRARSRAGRQSTPGQPAPGSTPTTTLEPASSTIAASSRAGQPRRHRLRDGARASSTPRTATNQSTELGRAIVTMSPLPIPRRCEVVGGPVGGHVELAPGQRLAAARDGRPVGIGGGQVGQPAGEGDERHRPRVCRGVRRVSRRRRPPRTVSAARAC